MVFGLGFVEFRTLSIYQCMVIYEKALSNCVLPTSYKLNSLGIVFQFLEGLLALELVEFSKSGEQVWGIGSGTG